MKKCIKTILCGLLASLITTSVFAEPPARKSPNPAAALTIVEALQTTFRSVSETLLPAVVEVDVTETKTVSYSNPFDDFGFSSPFDFFFGNPYGNNGNEDKKQERQYETKGLGSGVIVKKSGNTYYVLTNNHVAGNASKISVKMNDGREFEGKLVGNDERIDIALISFESKDKSIAVAKLGDSDSVMPGDLCMAFGAPLGYSQSVTQGIISATGRSESQMSSISDYIQTDAAINQGNSGGPLVNIYGEVIGINTWIASSSGGSIGLGFAIPINNIKDSIDAFIKDGKISYGWLGVQLLDIDKDTNYKEELGVKDAEGAFAAEVFINSPAYKAGIKPGDYITKINGKAVKNVNQLVRDVGNLRVGTTATFEIIRNGKQISDVTVKIEERSKEVESQNGKLWPGFIALPLTDDLRTQLGIEDNKVQGVVVSSVVEKSPAAALKLQNNEVITAVNGKDISNVREFYQALSESKKSINFDTYSNGGTVTTGTYKLK